MKRRIFLSRFTYIGFALLVCAAIAVPVFVDAQPVSSEITNPIGCKTIDACILRVVDYVLGLAGVLALAAIVYGGFLYITAAGNQDRIEAGKHAVFYSIVGLVVIALSYAILTFVFTSLGGRNNLPGGGQGRGSGGASQSR